MTERILNGRYRILNKVGSGGMADVYKAVDLQENRIVAIKVLKQEYSDDPLYLRRLTREAQAMVSLTNEHVVTLYDMGSDGDIHYLVLEYVNGKTLREYMDEQGKLDPKEAVGIITDVLEGLDHAHKKGLIHRDVKPQNIMITDEGCIKLTDFGIAKFAGNATKTYDGKEAMGSVYYISPEQAKGETVDVQTDLYSAGIMLYEMLTGEPPFNGENAVQVALKHINEEIIPLHEADSGISIALSDVVAKATAKDRNIRYSSAAAMREDLEHALRSPHSRFAKIHNKIIKSPEGGEAEENGEDGALKEHLPLIAVIGSVIGIIAVFLIMFIVSMSKGNIDYSKVPSFLGYSEEAAKTYAENRGFKLEVAGYESSDEYSAGIVCGQSPEAQTKAKPGSVVYVTISSGMETATVPDLYGMTVEEAKRALEAAGLQLDKNIEYQTSSEPVGTVIHQSVDPQETVMAGDAVAITVCRETAYQSTKMPELVGSDINSAIDILEEAGITDYRIIVGNYSDDTVLYNDYTIVDQNPSGGMDIIFDTVIVELKMQMANKGGYKAEFSENVILSGESNDVVFTMVTDIGEIVLYRGEFDSGTYSIPFTGRYWKQGNYTCIIYVNAKIYTSFTRKFE
ncbi:MAG: Stk1 family PASTA domain-containing Ser/Thr kinase [Clostridia bacterium]|nr:Stk1 family PASTA domain-containing Ser/Thr kinase [Clostridia bacterium]